MKLHDRLTPAILDRINSYALGALPSGDSLRFEAHLAQGCLVCEAELQAISTVVSAMAVGVPRLSPPPRVRERLLAKIQAEPPQPLTEAPPAVERAPADARYVVRAADAWHSAGVPGVTAKQLALDVEQNRVTMLVRMEPGAVYPSHRHLGPEHCLVLEGDLTNDVTLQAGDYAYQPAHSTHPVSRTENGCLLLLIACTRDELLP